MSVLNNARGWIPASLISFLATKAVPGSFQKLNQLLKKTPSATESKYLKAIDASKAWQYSQKAADQTVPASPKPAAPVARKPAAAVAKRPATVFQTIKRILEVLMPWMVAFLFGKTAWDLLALIIRRRRRRLD